MPENISEIKAERVSETLVVYQQKGVFSFGTDAMLLADYVSEQQSAAGAKKLCDLCSGTGILSLVLCDRFPGLAAEAIEINPAAARLSEKTSKARRFPVRCAKASKSSDFLRKTPMRPKSEKIRPFAVNRAKISLSNYEIYLYLSDTVLP